MPADLNEKFDEVFAFGVEWQPIAPEARLVWTLAAAAIASPFLLCGLVVLTLAGGVGGFGAGLAISAMVLALLRRLVVRRHRSWGYCVREDELVLRRGLLLRKLTIVPMGRMQFVDIEQGPLDRWLGVANLQLHTAAAASDAKIPMLSLVDASNLRDELTNRVTGRSGGT